MYKFYYMPKVCSCQSAIRFSTNTGSDTEILITIISNIAKAKFNIGESIAKIIS